MSISKWKELAESETEIGKKKRDLYDKVTEEKVR